MKNLSIFAGGAFVVASSSLALFGSGVAAAAPDVIGQPYSDAVSAIEEEGSTAIVAVRTGDKLPQDECIVTNAWDAPYLRPMTDDVYFEKAQGEVMVALNCAGGYATATNPGASLLSPAGREAKAAADEAAAAEEQELAEVSTPDE
ncbi:MAG TPA: hypothetical protein VJ777_25955 [Mycobacterium sp.]|nr:hypothetical protein [Mycobacterium sp.]